MKHLFFDTETTGLPKGGIEPRIVQLAALLTDDLGNELDSMNVIIYPDTFTIPAEAAKVHGITTERAMKEGITISSAMIRFNALVGRSSIVIAHNLSFDYGRYVHEVKNTRLSDLILNKETFCTMKAATPIVQCPPTERMLKYGHGYKFKPPKLQEAFVHFKGYEFEGAHDALADVKACRDVYFCLKELGVAA